jgi:hypothetical protein
MIPGRVEAKLSALFSGHELDEAVRLLPPRPSTFGDDGYDELLMAITKLSEGDLDRLRYFASRAHDFPDDVVGWGRLREVRSTLRPRSKVQMLEKGCRLRGGPMAIADVTPNPLADDEDLWHGLGVATAFLCSVCRQEYGSVTPEIWLSQRVEAGGLSARRIRVHPSCIPDGESLARAQGYGWHQGAGPGPKGTTN